MVLNNDEVYKTENGVSYHARKIASYNLGSEDG